MEDLQAQLEELKSAQVERNKRELAEQRHSIGSQSVSCLKELYDVHQNRCVWVWVVIQEDIMRAEKLLCVSSGPPLASWRDCFSRLKVRRTLLDIIHKRKLILLLSAVFLQIQTCRRCFSSSVELFRD